MIHLRVDVEEQSQVGAARRAATDLAHQQGMSETDCGRVALLTTEAATNLVKFATEGSILMRATGRDGAAGVELLVLDRGPGIPNVTASLRDGYSTAGTPGTGLGAIFRGADEVDIHSAPGMGTALVLRIHAATRSPLNDRPESSIRFGAVCVPKPNEVVSGDAWAVVLNSLRAVVLVVDGLGHGALAAEASAEALRLFRAHQHDPVAEIVERLHLGMRHTRGAAVGVAELDLGAREVRFAGIGNIAAAIIEENTTRNLASLNGIVGHQVRRIQEFRYPLQPPNLLIMNSDGLSSRWSLERYAGATRRDPSLLAGMLYRDFQRGTDDTTVVVTQIPAPPAAPEDL
jgi:anti-sigma regulatory factor (Ser/Thr protein kinase)